jgi:hypothetical protein
LTKINSEEKSPALPSRWESGKVRAIEWRTIQILLFGATASLFWQDWLFSAGFIFGGAVSLVNFHWLSLIMEKVFLERKPWHGVQVPIKFFALVLAVFAILTQTRVSAIGFLAGTLSLVAGILFEAARQGSRA